MITSWNHELIWLAIGSDVESLLLKESDDREMNT